jgi:hypothetical protein
VNDGARPVLRALIETVLAFDHPAFPAIGVEQVERRLLEYFPVAGEDDAGFAAFDDAFTKAGGGRFAAAPLAERRAFLRRWARGETPAQRGFYTSVKSMVLIAAYSLPELQRAIGHQQEDPR